MVKHDMKKFIFILFSIIVGSLQIQSSFARGGYTSRSYAPKSYSSPRNYTPRKSYSSSRVGSNYNRSYNSPGEHYTRGYQRQDGTYVRGYHATNPNNTRQDNWSSRGNINPYTGQPGAKNPYP